jgi:hypothetical protein
MILFSARAPGTPTSAFIIPAKAQLKVIARIMPPQIYYAHELGWRLSRSCGLARVTETYIDFQESDTKL